MFMKLASGSSGPCVAYLNSACGSQTCTVGLGVADKGPWLPGSHKLIVLTGGQSARAPSNPLSGTGNGPHQRHIQLMDVEPMNIALVDSMAWSELSPHCLPVAALTEPLLLWQVSRVKLRPVSLMPWLTRTLSSSLSNKALPAMIILTWLQDPAFPEQCGVRLLHLLCP